jgi:hypothetical protein
MATSVSALDLNVLTRSTITRVIKYRYCLMDLFLESSLDFRNNMQARHKAKFTPANQMLPRFDKITLKDQSRYSESD